MKKLDFLSLSFILVVFSYSCTTNREEAEVEKKDTLFVVNDTVLESPVSGDTSVMEDFRNIEFVDYCLPLPLHGFKEDFGEEQVKGKHVFLDEKNSAYFIEVQGLLRENPLVSLADYFANSYTIEDEEQGKIVLEKKIISEVNAFYATGYYNNKIYDERFLEITWLRKDEVVKLTANFAIQDTTQWKKWLIDYSTVTTICAE